jgi:hypothetical protein
MRFVSDEKPENESGEPPESGAVVVSLDLARAKRPPSKKPKAKKQPVPTIAEQLAAQKKRAKAEAEAAQKAAKRAAKKRRPGNGSSARDALFKGFAQSLERASKQGEGFASDEPDETTETEKNAGAKNDTDDEG